MSEKMTERSNTQENDIGNLIQCIRESEVELFRTLENMDKGHGPFSPHLTSEDHDITIIRSEFHGQYGQTNYTITDGGTKRRFKIALDNKTPIVILKRSPIDGAAIDLVSIPYIRRGEQIRVNDFTLSDYYTNELVTIVTIRELGLQLWESKPNVAGLTQSELLKVPFFLTQFILSAMVPDDYIKRISVDFLSYEGEGNYLIDPYVIQKDENPLFYVTLNPDTGIIEYLYYVGNNSDVDVETGTINNQIGTIILLTSIVYNILRNKEGE